MTKVIEPGTLVLVSPDCPVDKSAVPKARTAHPNPPIHVIPYEVLTEQPYKYDEPAFQREVYLVRRGTKDRGA